MVQPEQVLLRVLLHQAIKERVTHYSYRLLDDVGTLLAKGPDGTFEVIPPPLSTVPGLFAELARLAKIDAYSSKTSGTFQLVNTTLRAFGSWNGDRPIAVDVTLSEDHFELELTYSDTPIDPIEETIEILRP